jgi:hypothetical protein
MKPSDPPQAQLAVAETLEALPALLTLARQAVTAAFQAGDAESEELKSLLDACVVGAHRLKLREQLRSGEACDCP